MLAKKYLKPYTRTISFSVFVGFYLLSVSLIHSFKFPRPVSRFAPFALQWLHFIYADSFLMFRFVPNFDTTKVKTFYLKANERMCVLVSVLSCVFFICLPSECAAQNKHKHRHTHIYTRIHLRANINGNDRRDMHILMHTSKKGILIHATHSFAFLSASSFSGQFMLLPCSSSSIRFCKFKFLKCRPLSKFKRILWNKWINLYAG